jgi:hypothetical protein
MKNAIRLIACCAIIVGLYSPAHAQRAIGARSFILDDGLGNTVTITIPSPSVSGTFTIPSGGGSATPNGTVTGQMLRWNAGLVPPAWEVGTATNIGANMSIGAGTMTAGNFAGNLNGETNAQLHTASLLTGTYAALNGSAITNLNASNLSSGTVSDTRLSANVPLLNAANSFTAANTFSNAASTFAGNAATATTAGNVSGVVAVANGGTGGNTQASARAGLGLGTIATQNANSVTITGGTINSTSLGTSAFPDNATLGTVIMNGLNTYPPNESDGATAGNTVTISGNVTGVVVNTGLSTNNVTASVTTALGSGVELYIFNNLGGGFTVSLAGFAVPDQGIGHFMYFNGAWRHVQ